MTGWRVAEQPFQGILIRGEKRLNWHLVIFSKGLFLRVTKRGIAKIVELTIKGIFMYSRVTHRTWPGLRLCDAHYDLLYIGGSLNDCIDNFHLYLARNIFTGHHRICSWQIRIWHLAQIGTPVDPRQLELFVKLCWSC